MPDPPSIPAPVRPRRCAYMHLPTGRISHVLEVKEVAEAVEAAAKNLKPRPGSGHTELRKEVRFSAGSILEREVDVRDNVPDFAGFNKACSYHNDKDNATKLLARLLFVLGGVVLGFVAGDLGNNGQQPNVDAKYVLLRNGEFLCGDAGAYQKYKHCFYIPVAGAIPHYLVLRFVLTMMPPAAAATAAAAGKDDEDEDTAVTTSLAEIDHGADRTLDREPGRRAGRQGLPSVEAAAHPGAPAAARGSSGRRHSWMAAGSAAATSLPPRPAACT